MARLKGRAQVQARLIAMLWSAGAAILLGRSSTCTAQCGGYSVDVIALPYCGIPGYGLGPQACSDTGQIVGAYGLCSEQTGAFLWDGTLPINFLNLGPGVTAAIGNDINSKLQIVGTKEGPTGHIGFLYHNGITIDIGMLPGSNFAEAYAINEAGVACGFSHNNQTGPKKAFLWSQGKLNELVTSIGPSRVANDINDVGQVVGWMGQVPNPPFYGEAFLWDVGNTIPLGFPPPGTNSEAMAISNNGHVCGVFSYPNPQGGALIRRAILWKDGINTEMGILPGYLRSFAMDVNNDGTVVGYCSNNLPSHAFIWRNGIMTDLNENVASEMNLTLNQAMSINNNGQILCAAHDENGASVAVLLTPIPSPIGDSDCDGDIDTDDLLGVINNWAHQSPKGSKALPPCDFDHDGTVELDDLMIVIDNWTGNKA